MRVFERLAFFIVLLAGVEVYAVEDPGNDFSIPFDKRAGLSNVNNHLHYYKLRSWIEIEKPTWSTFNNAALESLAQKIEEMAGIANSAIKITDMKEGLGGFYHIRLSQELCDTPVIGGEIAVHLYPDMSLFSFNGKFNDGNSILCGIEIDFSQAVSAGHNLVPSDYTLVGEVSKIIVANRFAVKMDFVKDSANPRITLFIDGVTGELLLEKNSMAGEECSSADPTCVPDTSDYGEICDEEIGWCVNCDSVFNCGPDCDSCQSERCCNHPYYTYEFECQENCWEEVAVYRPENCIPMEYYDCLSIGEVGFDECYYESGYASAIGCVRPPEDEDNEHYLGNLLLYNPPDDCDVYHWGVLKREDSEDPYEEDHYWWYQDTDVWASIDELPLSELEEWEHRAAFSCAKNISLVQQYTYDVLGRDSFDDMGGFVGLVLNATDSHKICNAFVMNDGIDGKDEYEDWHVASMEFGLGDELGDIDNDNGWCYSQCTLDAVGHEFAHLVEAHEMELPEYVHQSFADIFGHLVEDYYQDAGYHYYNENNNLGEPWRYRREPGHSDWLHGEDAVFFVPDSESKYNDRYAKRDFRMPWELVSPQDYDNLGELEYWPLEPEEPHIYPSWYEGWLWCAYGPCADVNHLVHSHAFYVLSTGGSGTNPHAASPVYKKVTWCGWSDDLLYLIGPRPCEYYPISIVDKPNARKEAGRIITHTVLNHTALGAEDMVEMAKAWEDSALMLAIANENEILEPFNVLKAWQAVGVNYLPTPQIPDEWGPNTIPEGWVNWHGFNGMIPIEIDTKGVGDHDIQVRWCDCTGYQDEESCITENCVMDNPSQHYGVQFEHEGWHLASLNSSDKAIPRIKEEESPCQSYPRFTPRVDCPTEHPVMAEYWSQCGFDEATGLYTHHCSPSVEEYGRKGRETLFWDWKKELWWRNYDSPQGPMNREPPVWGYLWVRPEIDDRIPPDEDVVNSYVKFEIPLPFATINPFGMYQLGISYATLANANWDNRIVDSQMKQELEYLRKPMTGLFTLAKEDAANAGKFGYGQDLINSDSAIGGLLHVIIDGYTSEISEIGYASGETAGDVPNTVEFAAAQYTRWDEIAGGEIEFSHGIAVFGGKDGREVVQDKLWVGVYDGVDTEGNPVYNWRNAEPVGGTKPDPRQNAGLVSDPWNNRLLLYGGELPNSSSVGELWSYSFENNTWQELLTDVNLPALSKMTMLRDDNVIILIGGVDENGSGNSIIYRMLTKATGPPEAIGDLGRGPGMRREILAAIHSPEDPRIVVYGGVDINGIERSDVWEYEIRNRRWFHKASGCEGESCPAGKRPAFLVADNSGEDIAVYTKSEGGTRVYYKMREDNSWVVDREVHVPFETDCNGDGILDPITIKACRNSTEWYANNGRLACVNPAAGQIECTASATEQMSPIASWSPQNWESIVDFTKGEEAYDYVLTDGALYTFDVFEPGASLVPVDQDVIEIPPECGWGSGTDWSNKVEINKGYLYVGSLSGMHVFDLSDPANPNEVGHFASYGPVADISLAGDFGYLADGRGVTVLDLRDPSEPIEVNRKFLGQPVRAIDFNLEDWKLYSLTPDKLHKFGCLRNPANPFHIEFKPILVPGLWRMRNEGRWIYMSGGNNRSFYDHPILGLVPKGEHNVRPWVLGRVVREKQAERIFPPVNRFEVWAEAE